MKSQIEIIGLFLNNIFLIVGMYFLGWSVFETLLFYLIEPIVGILGLYLYRIHIPHKSVAPSIKKRAAYRNEQWITGLNIISTIIVIISLTPILLTQAIDYSNQFSKDEESMITFETISISLLLLITYIFPLFMFFKQRGKDAYIYLPLQSKLMVNNWQQCQLNVLTIGLFVIICFTSTDYQLILSIMLVIKTVIEWLIYKNMDV